jgi:hypothetical protein
MMSSTEHFVRTALVLAWAGWISYICAKRAISPPKDQPGSFWRRAEVESVNRNWAVRILMLVCSFLVLAIGVGVVLGR